MAAERPTFDYVCGASANAALAALTKGLGQRSLQWGVRVMGVHPPATRTERIDAMMRVAARERYGDETRTADLIRDRFASPAIDAEQVADSVVYVASARASQLSGIVFNLGILSM
jgi:3-oxoacyl-[acyl-carrier protein] reductase